ncbi:hypothetical protein BDR04DRAFT_1123552 [Suillus decipiens]|nr:hypothetical protein BDR04DRAFT_1123552 [Suillus decipiens]
MSAAVSANAKSEFQHVATRRSKVLFGWPPSIATIRSDVAWRVVLSCSLLLRAWRIEVICPDTPSSGPDTGPGTPSQNANVKVTSMVLALTSYASRDEKVGNAVLVGCGGRKRHAVGDESSQVRLNEGKKRSKMILPSACKLVALADGDIALSYLSENVCDALHSADQRALKSTKKQGLNCHLHLEFLMPPYKATSKRLKSNAASSTLESRMVPCTTSGRLRRPKLKQKAIEFSDHSVQTKLFNAKVLTFSAGKIPRTISGSRLLTKRLKNGVTKHSVTLCNTM